MKAVPTIIVPPGASFFFDLDFYIVNGPFIKGEAVCRQRYDRAVEHYRSGVVVARVWLKDGPEKIYIGQSRKR